MYFLGIDWGASIFKIGLVKDSQVLYLETADSRFFSNPGSLYSFILSFIKKHTSLRKIRGLGIGCPGVVDVRRGFVYYFPNIKGWKNVPLARILEGRLKLPVYVDNDANMVALGEARFGAGKGFKNLIVITLGTGLGAGIIIEGRLFHSPFTSGSELGHITVDYQGKRCGCGSFGCIETFVGNRYLVDYARSLLKRKPSNIIKEFLKRDKLSPKLLTQAALKGCKVSQEIWERTARILGRFLVGLVNSWGPEAIVIGGGLSGAGKFLFGPLREEVRRLAMPPQNRYVRILRARLKEKAGILGAKEGLIDYKLG